MKIKTVKTGKISKDCLGIEKILDLYLKKLKEKSVVVITSKVISICEGAILEKDGIGKKELIWQEADFYIPHQKNKYGMTLTVKNNFLVPTAGIDESNADGNYIFWPRNPQKSANKIRKYLKNKFKLNQIGVIITDSRTTPARMGTLGFGIAFSGFKPINNYIGKKDIFGRKMKVTRSNIIDGLSSAAVMTMGEGSEQTPIAIIEDLPFVKFTNNNPTQKEIKSCFISQKNDIYGVLFKNIKWKKGGRV